MTVPEFQKNKDACIGILDLMKTLDPKNTTHWEEKTLSCRLDLTPLLKAEPDTIVDLLRNVAKELKRQEHWVLIPDIDPYKEIKPVKLNPDTVVVPGKKDTGDLLQYIADMME